MRKTVPGASIKMAIAVAVLRSAGTQHCNNAWPTGLGVAAVHRVRTRPRRNHPRQLDPGGAKATLAHQLRQLSDVGCNPPRLLVQLISALALLRNALLGAALIKL
jgi:hypothetical protein